MQIIVLGLLVAVASAAPVAEESIPTADIKELLDNADPEQNDITVPETEEETPLTDVIEQQLDAAESGKKDLQENENAVNAETVAADETTLEDEVPNETETEVASATNEKETGEPVNEVIPPPEVAFVLGDTAEEELPNVEDSYQIVQGEQEDGTPVISEYVPEVIDDSVLTDEEITDDVGAPESNAEEIEPIVTDVDSTAVVAPEEVVLDAPVDEAIDYDYNFGVQPADHHYDDYSFIDDTNMDPTVTIDHIASLSIDTPDYDLSSDYDVPFDEPSLADLPVHEPDYDYAFDSSFIGPLAHPDSEDTFHFATPSDPLMPGPVMNDEGFPQEQPDTFFQPSDMFSFNNPDIIAGALETYHPSPISGVTPDEMIHGVAEADYPVYEEEPIVPAAMINSNVPISEGFPDTDNLDAMPVPERVDMGDFPVDDADLLIEDSNVGLDDFDATALMPEDDLSNAVGSPIEDSETNPEIVIKLSLGNQDASINGRPFDLRESQNILDFIEKLIFRATKTPVFNEIDNMPSSFPSYKVRPFNFRFLDSSFLNPYATDDEMNYRDNSYYGPYSNDFDSYNPYFPLSNRFVYKNLRSELDNIQPDFYHDRFGVENSPRNRRYTYDAFWL